MTQAVLKELAKAELHCHLDGSLSLPAIRKLANMADIILPSSDKELRKYVIAPAQTESLVDYLKKRLSLSDRFFKRRKHYVLLLMMLLDRQL